MTSTFLSASASTLRPSVFAELTPKIRALGSRCIPLHIGDTYRLPPKAALESLRDAELSSTQFFKYTHPYGRVDLIEALVEKLRRDNGIQTTSDCIQVTCGATQGLCAVAQTMMNPGDELVVLCPHWPLIRGIVETIGGKVVDAPYAESIADPHAVLAPLITERTKAIYLANPNNPDGQLLDGEKARRLHDFAKEKDLFLWSDEAYDHLVYDQNTKVSLASLDQGEKHPRVVSVFTFSKSFGMAGMRVGYVVGPADIMTFVRRVSTHQIYDLSGLTQEAALAALNQPRPDYEAYLSEQVEAYQEARNLLHTAFPGSPLPPGGAYLYVPFETKQEAWDAMLRWLEEGVSSAPGDAFGSLHQNCLRLCFTAIPLERIEKAVEIIKRVG
jgi:aspartate/methionine/tyrosine aminotransferase